MAISLLGPLNKVINETANQIISSKLTEGVTEVLNTVVKSSFSIVDDTLESIKEATKEQQP
ncbi:MAG: hypothetical protein OEV42_03860 [Deltaproteobacteria bacterium]|nr:hypothetical protein [Deltaproteobacteria bacterium]